MESENCANIKNEVNEVFRYDTDVIRKSNIYIIDASNYFAIVIGKSVGKYQTEEAFRGDKETSKRGDNLVNRRWFNRFPSLLS